MMAIDKTTDIKLQCYPMAGDCLADSLMPTRSTWKTTKFKPPYAQESEMLQVIECESSSQCIAPVYSSAPATSTVL